MYWSTSRGMAPGGFFRRNPDRWIGATAPEQVPRLDSGARSARGRPGSADGDALADLVDPVVQRVDSRQDLVEPVEDLPIVRAGAAVSAAGGRAVEATIGARGDEPVPDARLELVQAAGEVLIGQSGLLRFDLRAQLGYLGPGRLQVRAQADGLEQDKHQDD